MVAVASLAIIALLTPGLVAKAGSVPIAAVDNNPASEGCLGEGETRAYSNAADGLTDNQVTIGGVLCERRLHVHYCGTVPPCFDGPFKVAFTDQYDYVLGAVSSNAYHELNFVLGGTIILIRDDVCTSSWTSGAASCP